MSDKKLNPKHTIRNYILEIGGLLKEEVPSQKIRILSKFPVGLL